jgi:hypothetical protein
MQVTALRADERERRRDADRVGALLRSYIDPARGWVIGVGTSRGRAARRRPTKAATTNNISASMGVAFANL